MDIEKLVSKINVTPDAETDKKTLNDILKAQEKTKKEYLADNQLGIWRIIMKTRITKLTAAAVIIIAVLIGINQFGVDSASKVFAAAIDSVRQARTFSCIETLEHTKDGQQHINKLSIMFKEPDRERYEWIEGEQMPIGEVSITHYGKRQRLNLNTNDETASLVYIGSEYAVEEDTGILNLTQLNTSIRDRLIDWGYEAVEDLGRVELNGQVVRLLQSRQDGNVIQVWIDPQTDLPVQIAVQKPKYKLLYTAIQIDEELDDELFSLESPEGYSLFKGGLYVPFPDYIGQLYAKMRHLSLMCITYASNHEGQFPRELSDIPIESLSDEALRKILAAPNRPDGPAAIRYRQPLVDADRSKEVMLYEIYDKWPERGIAVCFADGHCEVIVDEKHFEELVR